MASSRKLSRSGGKFRRIFSMSMNNYITLIASFSLMIASLFLTIYNFLYVYRVKEARKKIGINLPRVIKRLSQGTIFLSFGVTIIFFIVFLHSLLFP